MKSLTAFILIAVTTLILVGCSGSESPESGEATTWTCSMHPQIQLPEPGQCPICFMDLIPLADDGEETGPRELAMTEASIALAEIRTWRVARRAVEVRTDLVGHIDYDETRVKSITTWVSGRLDRLFVDYTGVTVHEGDHLVEIYSPELRIAQTELIEALNTVNTGAESIRKSAQQTVDNAREKLRLWGLLPEQIKEIETRGTPTDHIVIRAPVAGVVVHKNATQGMYVKTGTPIYQIADLSRVWVQLKAYEIDLAWIRFGQTVEITTEAYPDQKFAGTVAFINPTVNMKTRTVDVRVNVENPDLRLKPGMFANAVVYSKVSAYGTVMDPALAGKWISPMHPEIVKDEPGQCDVCGMDLVTAEELGYAEPEGGELPIVIPERAPLITGKRAVVYVRVPGKERPTFEGREITLGPRAGRWFIVRDGLEVGEDVVIEGAFKIDSELQIKAKPSMMYPEEEPEAAVKTPAAFQEQLGGLINAYFNLQVALADDAVDRLPAATKGVTDRLGAVDMSLLDDKGHMAWMPLRRVMTDSLGKMQDADIDAIRSAFAGLSSALIETIDTFGIRSELEARVAFCPMALNDTGAEWLQSEDMIANPYFGASMLRCGEVRRTIAPTTE